MQKISDFSVTCNFSLNIYLCLNKSFLVSLESMRNDLANRNSDSPSTQEATVPSDPVPNEQPPPITPFHPLAVMSAQARLALLASNIQHNNQSESSNSQLPVTSNTSGSNPLYNLNSSGFDVMRLSENDQVKNEGSSS